MSTESLRLVTHEPGPDPHSADVNTVLSVRVELLKAGYEMLGLEMDGGVIFCPKDMEEKSGPGEK